MTGASNAFELVIGNDLANIALVSDRLHAFCADHGLPAAFADIFALALDELIANVVNHGFPQGAHHTIRIEGQLDANRLRVELADSGRAFNPLKDAPPPDLDSPLEDRRVGGLGVHFVRTLMDQVEYRREDGCNIMVMSKAHP